MSCPDLVTDLTLDEALAVLEPYFDAVKDRYLDQGFERVSRTRLYCAPWVRDSPRHFAACREDGRAIIAAPELAELSQEIVVAIKAHELGHAVDFLYPGEFWLGRDGGIRRQNLDEVDDTQRARVLRAWESRDAHLVEVTADRIAEHVMGEPIGYVGPCSLQCFSRGKARPQSLR